MGEANYKPNKYVHIAHADGERCSGEKQRREAGRKAAQGAFLGWGSTGSVSPE